jgi:SnoaL-like domain
MAQTVDETLDRMHTAAAKADLESYFDCFTDDGCFIGTDSTERWTIVPDFYNYTKPYFDQGIGWTYTPVSRHIKYLNNEALPTASGIAAVTTSADTSTNMLPPPTATVAIFDEILSHERFGVTRNSGVMVLQRLAPQEMNFIWKIVQYHLTIPIPNRYVDTVVKIIQQSE